MYVAYGSLNLSSLAGYPAGTSALSYVSSFTQSREYSQRGAVDRIVKQMTIAGEICVAGQTEIGTAIAALEGALSNSGQSVGLMRNDNVATPHFLDAATSLGGVKLVSGPDYSDSSPAEYATGRKWQATFRAEYEPSVTSDLLSYSETFQRTGGGARFVWDEVLSGTPISYQTAAQTIGRLTQSGSAVGRSSFPFFPALVYPAYFQQPQSSESYGRPAVVDGRITNYQISWNYVYEGPSLFSFPTLPGV